MKGISPLILLIFTPFVSVYAHESRPVFIQIKQEKAVIKIAYSVPNTVDYRNLPNLILPDFFLKDTVHTLIRTNNEGFIYEDIFIRRDSLGKGTISDLKGQKIAWKFPYYNPTLSAVVQIYFENAPETHVLSPQNDVLDLTEKAKNSLKVHAFLSLGVEHIFKGIDHLLFVVCLLLITGMSRKLFWTITGFTMAHSITLFLSVLGFVKIPIPFVEVCIALSIIFLCCEIIHHFQGKTSLTYRFPMLISASFGLLHGLGFAAVLIEIGLPENNLIPALLFFNVGVELGQLLFIGSLILLFFILKKGIINRFLIQEKYTTMALKIGVYAIGIVASFWFFERISAWY